jgi:hypothetical protein
MPAISFTEDPQHPGFAELAKHQIGDRVRIVRVNQLEHMPDDAKADLLAAVGRTLKIKDILLWETGDPKAPLKLTYEFHIAHLRGAPRRSSFLIWIYLDDQEIKPLRRMRNRGADAATLSKGRE